jgi:hypothetical protein
MDCYIKNVWELETYLKQIEHNIEETEEEHKKYESLKEEYKNERLNNEGLSQDAHLQINVANIEVKDRQNFKNINVTVIMENLDVPSNNFNTTVNHSGRDGDHFIFDKNLEMYEF